MKRSVLILILCLPMLGWTQTAALDQEVTFEYINLGLEEVLADISSNYKVYFSYSKDFVSIDREVNWRARNRSLREALDRLFKKLDIEYKIIGNQVLLKQGPEPPVSVPERPIQEIIEQQDEKLGTIEHRYQEHLGLLVAQ